MSTFYVSVDVETAGPSPDRFAMLSIGAVAVDSMADTFYIELQPDRPDHDPQAMSVHGLSLERLAREGLPPSNAMQQFEEWVLGLARGRKPVFVAYNAPFDWMFVNVYFHRYLGRNPFGHGALDMKALYMGISVTEWPAIGHGDLARRYSVRPKLTHNALDDAMDQALMFRAMLDQAKQGALGG
ncbi:MAG TPA: 3'-5' exonuclease [Chloroflexia bacterium]|nr:3'-5' exonuclease [Chloroflexia bacterium]